jgi:hypothetical protein
MNDADGSGMKEKNIRRLREIAGLVPIFFRLGARPLAPNPSICRHQFYNLCGPAVALAIPKYGQ